MGNCGGTEKDIKRVSYIIDSELKENHHVDKVVKKLLLLGAGESGKSTLFKQALILFGKGFTLKNQQDFLPLIVSNIVSSLQILISNAGSEDISIVSLAESNLVHANMVSNIKLDARSRALFKITPEIAYAFSKLWMDPGIRACFDNRSKFQIPGCAKYFLDRIDDLADPEYLPSFQDILQCRARTYGIAETQFTIGTANFSMMDVGGQRSERNKWIHCFEKVSAVLFVTAISEYDQLTVEEPVANRMDESLALFEEICISRWFKDTPIILFLNKNDLFVEKITQVPITVSPSLAAYDGPAADYDAALEFIKKTFIGKNIFEERTIYPHVTCATDSKTINAVFNVVKDTIIENALKIGEMV